MTTVLPATTFPNLCRLLGYEPSYVLSVRLNKSDAWVTYINGKGDLVTQAHEIQVR